MRVLREAVEEPLRVLVEQRVHADLGAELVELGPGGQLAVDEEPRRFEERSVLGELLDRDAAVAQDAGLAVEEGDRGLRGAGVHVAVVEGDEPGLGAQLRNVDTEFVFGAPHHRELDLGGSVTQDGGFVGHADSLVIRRRAPVVQFGSA